MASRILAILVLLFAVALLPSCDGDKPAADSMVPGDGLTCSGTIAYLENCTANEECTSCVCSSFGHSKYCSKACLGPADCPSPATACTNGFCQK